MDMAKEELPEDQSFADELNRHGLLLNDAGYVRWDKQNPKHPRNWSGKRKAYNTIVILCLEFITYVILEFDPNLGLKLKLEDADGDE